MHAAHTLSCFTWWRYWPFVRGIHRSPVNSPQKVQWRGALMFCLICAWRNRWVNNCEAGDLRCHLGHYDVIVMIVFSDWSVLSILIRSVCWIRGDDIQSSKYPWSYLKWSKTKPSAYFMEYDVLVLFSKTKNTLPLANLFITCCSADAWCDNSEEQISIKF